MTTTGWCRLFCIFIVLQIGGKVADGQTTADEDVTATTDDIPEECQNIKLPTVQQFSPIENDNSDVIGYRLILRQNDVTVVPTWHRFLQIPEIISHEYNYPLPLNDPQFHIQTHYHPDNVVETSVHMTSQYDKTQYGLQLDMTSYCGPISVYIKPHMREFENVTKLPTIVRKVPSVATINNVCEEQTVDMVQITKFSDTKIEGTAGLTQILAKKLGVNDMEETYQAYEFNPDPEAHYNLETVHSDTASIAKQSWQLDDTRSKNYIGLYQFYLTMDSQDPIYNVTKKDPMVYMLGVPFVVKPDNFEAISVGILPCFPFRLSSSTDQELPIKRLGFAEGYRPCFRVLTQTSRPIKLRLEPYEEDVTNPLPTYSGPDIGGTREHWYVLDDARVPRRINEYQLTVVSHEFVFMVPFVLTRYVPAQPVIQVQDVPGKGKTLTCTTKGFPEPKVQLYEMDQYHTLGGDSHWYLERIINRYHPLKSEENYLKFENVTGITERQIGMTVSLQLEERLVKLTTNKVMPYGIACVSWNEYSHNIAFWSPLKHTEIEAEEKSVDVPIAVESEKKSGSEKKITDIEVQEKLLEEVAAKDVPPEK